MSVLVLKTVKKLHALIVSTRYIGMNHSRLLDFCIVDIEQFIYFANILSIMLKFIAKLKYMRVLPSHLMPGSPLAFAVFLGEKL